MKGSVKEPNKFHNHETEKITLKPVTWQKTCNYIKLFEIVMHDAFNVIL